MSGGNSRWLLMAGCVSLMGGCAVGQLIGGMAQNFEY